MLDTLLARQPTRALGFSAPQPATAKPASPWGRPEQSTSWPEIAHLSAAG